MFETLLGLFLVALSDFSTPRTDVILKRMKRVVGGDKALIDQVPYLVNIRRNGVFECGGSLITPSCVLTAAHCVKSGNPKDFIVRGGVTYLRDKANSRRVRNIYVPALYNNKSLNYDVAVFELSSPFKSPKIQTIQLAKEVPEAGELVQVSGWGLTSEMETHPSNQIRTINVNIWPQSKCEELYRNYRNVTANMFCASVPGLKDACSADSGGPAVANGKIVGIVSWGRSYECARANSPGVYISVPAVRQWIDSVIQRACLN